MKTIMLTAGSLLLYSAALMAQKETDYSGNDNQIKAENTESEVSTAKSRRAERAVSYQTNQQFMRDFPDAENVQWNPGRPFEEATFTNDHIEMTAYYDVDSQLIGTTTEKKFSDIPAKAQEYIRKHYKGYSPETVLMFDDNEDNETDMILYNTAFDDADNYFVEIKNDSQRIILKVDMEGVVSFFKKL